MVEYILIWIFKVLMLGSGFMVIHSRNPVHSVFFLILVFGNGAVFAMMLDAEFLAMVLLVVYMGAIAVLFLFVVMMLNVKVVERREMVLSYVPVGFLIVLILGSEIGSLIDSTFVYVGNKESEMVEWVNLLDSMRNIEVLGELLYSYYVVVFIISGLILLNAMVGSIVLTMYSRGSQRRQEAYVQISRIVEEAIELKRMK